MFSIVIPVHNEAENVLPLAREIVSVFSHHFPQYIQQYEIIFVDDGSTDDTVQQLLQTKKEFPQQLRIIKHAKQSGQSASVRSGVMAAKYDLIITLDGDRQNDPNDIPILFQAYNMQHHNHGLVIGYRYKRHDNVIRKLSSRIANNVRNWILRDQTPDSGCGLKLFSKTLFMQLPYFDHMHRFMPILVRRAGYDITVVPINHRPRSCGQSKYGVYNRLWSGIVDLFGVRWLQARHRSPEKIEEL